MSMWSYYTYEAGLTGIAISEILHVTHDENRKIPEDNGSWILREMVLCVN